MVHYATIWPERSEAEHALVKTGTLPPNLTQSEGLRQTASLIIQRLPSNSAGFG